MISLLAFFKNPVVLTLLHAIMSFVVAGGTVYQTTGNVNASLAAGVAALTTGQVALHSQAPFTKT